MRVGLGDGAADSDGLGDQRRPGWRQVVVVSGGGSSTPSAVARLAALHAADACVTVLKPRRIPYAYPVGLDPPPGYGTEEEAANEAASASASDLAEALREAGIVSRQLEVAGDEETAVYAALRDLHPDLLVIDADRRPLLDRLYASRRLARPLRTRCDVLVLGT